LFSRLARIPSSMTAHMTCTCAIWFSLRLPVLVCIIHTCCNNIAKKKKVVIIGPVIADRSIIYGPVLKANTKVQWSTATVSVSVIYLILTDLVVPRSTTLALRFGDPVTVRSGCVVAVPYAPPWLAVKTDSAVVLIPKLQRSLNIWMRHWNQELGIFLRSGYSYAVTVHTKTTWFKINSTNYVFRKLHVMKCERCWLGCWRRSGSLSGFI